jgi:glutamate racemase
VEKSASLPLPAEPPQNNLSRAHVRDSLIVANLEKTSPQNHVLVLATTATVQSHAYTHALNALGLEAYEKACPLLVPLVEEGWTNHPVTDEVLRIYLTEALTAAPAAQTLLLGCTHYPLLEPAILRTLASMDHPLTIIDSAQATAHAVAAHPALACHLSNPKEQSCLFYATDSVEKFERLGSSFLGQRVTGVRHIDLGG